jgi:hypothetical protein
VDAIFYVADNGNQVAQPAGRLPAPAHGAHGLHPVVAGRKRHVIVDTIGLLLVVMVTSASVQDRDGARPALVHLRDLFESSSSRALRTITGSAGFVGPPINTEATNADNR